MRCHKGSEGAVNALFVVNTMNINKDQLFFVFIHTDTEN